MVNRKQFTSPFMWLIAAIGSAVFFIALSRFHRLQLDLQFLLLAAVLVAISSRIAIQIPRLSGQITVGDTVIFLALFLYGIEASVSLAWIEGACSALRVYKKPRTILFNAGLMAFSTFTTGWTVQRCFGPPTALTHGLFSAHFVMAICLMALVQYSVNTALAAMASAYKINQPVWPTWKKYYLWSSLTYVAGAAAAGLLAKLTTTFGFYALLVTLPIIAIIYFTYRTYLRSIEVSIAQAEQAERHVEELSRYIIERERAERERDQLLIREQEARREAEVASRVKDEFLATLSHELRTPMTAIVGWSHLLADCHLDKQQRAQAVEAIGRNARVQVQLINDLLDMSRIITGKLKVERHPIKLQSVIMAAIDSVRLAADAKSIRIETAMEPDAGIVAGDPDRLQQVVWNLLSNAIKFTPAGGRVTVSLKTVDGCAQLAVSDTGQGIKPEFLPYIFDRFRQADSSNRRTHGGMGLGLAIVRHLVELHGGTVQAYSLGEGQGTNIQVKLPLLTRQSESSLMKEMNGQNGKHDWVATLSGVSVLVVDDDADVLELLATVLQGHGAKVTTAASAAEALSAIKRAQPHVLISDISMPVTNGYELIRAIRSLPPENGGSIPAASVTAFAREEDRRQSLAAGFQTHIPKPVMPDELVEVVARLAGRASA